MMVVIKKDFLLDTLNEVIKKSSCVPIKSQTFLSGRRTKTFLNRNAFNTGFVLSILT